MPAHTPCAHCGTVGFVRWERIITGEESATEYYCGRCEHSWRVRDVLEQHTAPRPVARPAVTKPDQA